MFWTVWRESRYLSEIKSLKRNIKNFNDVDLVAFTILKPYLYGTELEPKPPEPEKPKKAKRPTDWAGLLKGPWVLVQLALGIGLIVGFFWLFGQFTGGEGDYCPRCQVAQEQYLEPMDKYWPVRAASRLNLIVKVQPRKYENKP